MFTTENMEMHIYVYRDPIYIFELLLQQGIQLKTNFKGCDNSKTFKKYI